MKKREIKSGLLLLVLLAALGCAAQVEVGDNAKLSLSGELTAGYNGSFGNTDVNSHAMDFGGSGALHGYYYSPQFLSFDVRPYYDRSQANSSYQSITDSSGFTTSANIFSGSRYPGSISFTRTSDSSGQFGIPGVTGLDTAGSARTFVVDWSADREHWPTLNASYVLSSDASTIFGTHDETTSSGRNLNLQSNYMFKGFQLNGFYLNQANHREIPAFLLQGTNQVANQGTSNTSSLGALLSHRFVLKGYWTASFNHSNFGTDSKSEIARGSGSGGSNSYNTSVSIQPLKSLGFSFGLGYQDNVFAAIQEQLLQAGTLLPLANSNQQSQSLNMHANAEYVAFKVVHLNGQVNRMTQYLGGKTLEVTQYGGGVSSSYARNFLGSFTFSVGALDTATQTGNNGASMYGNVGFSRRLKGWETTADLNYSQQVQTLGLIYTTSMYGYGGSVRRKFGDSLYWTNSARETHSGLSQVAGTTSHSESFLTNVLYKKYSLNAVYSKSGGSSILTSQGLVSVPGGIPTPLLGSPVLYGATSYGAGAGVTVKRLVVTMSYSKAFSNTSTATVSNNSMALWNGLLRIRMRKLYFNAGFTKFAQSVSAAGTLPTQLNTYYFGVSRWFNVF